MRTGAGASRAAEDTMKSGWPKKKNYLKTKGAFKHNPGYHAPSKKKKGY